MKNEARRCIVCKKALRSNNFSGYCSAHYSLSQEVKDYQKKYRSKKTKEDNHKTYIKYREKTLEKMRLKRLKLKEEKNKMEINYKEQEKLDQQAMDEYDLILADDDHERGILG